MNVSISSSVTGPIQNAIREATKLSHQRLDAAMTWVDLGRLNHYSGFLRGQAEALFPLETALERAGIDDILTDWPQRARTPALERDLSALDIACDPLPVPQFNGAADMLGAVYVLEGTRMASRVILPRLADQPDTSILGATAYLRHGFGKRFWPSFLAALENHPEAQLHPQRAIDGALIAFGMFDSALIPVMSHAIDRSRSAIRLVHSERV
ncbi:biliverdin-producing heme oxygenase [Bradyrhizobium prioriisuperbiae]|uniref:biliverdin-producing heme oxygenase n=1 Tax=Bradyrhizobium prioriisuperbiae TaxID=2854389 RepID=UPI0028F09083|nr:biliverdin-producing heme oxygenase [Bradyrhizobium prioritasuperba]